MRSDVKKSAVFLCFFIGGWLLLRLCLPILAPFLLGLALAALAEPLVQAMSRGLKMSRTPASIFSVTAVLAGVLGVLGLAGYLLVDRAAHVLPGMVREAVDFVGGVEAHLPQRVNAQVSVLLEDGTQVLSGAAGKLLSFAGTTVQALPGSLLGLGTGVLAAYLISVRLPELKRETAEFFRSRGLESVPRRMETLGRSLGGWLSCQLRLVMVTLAILTIGLTFLRVDHAPLWAAIICLVDILPVLGIGTVMLPWSALCALQGDLPRAAGLAGVYVIAAVTRSVLEPKLLGDHLGLSPLATLAAMYAGFRLWGITGLVILPIFTAGAVALLREEKK